MLSVSFAVLCTTVAVGLALILLHGLKSWRIIRVLGPLHGLVGATGLVLLVLSLRAGPRGVAAGVGSFGRTAAVLLGFALLAGLSLWRARNRRGDPTLLIGIHATLAIFGFVLLAAYMSVPG